jgi:hypothetical protein
MTTREKRTEAIRVQLRPSEARKIRQLAEQTDETISAFIRRAIRHLIASQGKDTQ